MRSFIFSILFFTSMRIEDVGSSSPAADILAFFVAVIITMGALALLSPDETEGKPFPFLTVVRELTDWTFLDEDRDGLLEMPSPGSFGNATPVGGGIPDILVHMKGEGSSIWFLVRSGIPSSGMLLWRNISAVHSFSVIIEDTDGPFAGTLSICGIEVME